MDRLDDQLIIDELKGAVIDTLVYSFRGEDGRQQEGLSKAGVDAVVADMAKQGEVLREISLETDWEPGGKAIIAKVQAARYLVSQDGREVLLETVWGTKRQALQMEIIKKGTDGKWVYSEGKPVKMLVDDPFYVEKAVTKAARNAKRRLMPETLIAKLIERAKQQKGKVKNIDVPPTPARQQHQAPKSESPPPEQTEAWNKLTAEEPEHRIEHPVGDITDMPTGDNQITRGLAMSALQANLHDKGHTTPSKKAAWLADHGYPASISRLSDAELSTATTILAKEQMPL